MKSLEIEKQLHQICLEVEKEFEMGGLSGGLYEDYAKKVAKRFLRKYLLENIKTKL